MRILIVKTSSLGDIVQAFPVLDYLKQRLPAVQIDWVAEERCAELPRAHPFIREVICVNTRLWRRNFLKNETRLAMGQLGDKLRQKEYDLVFDLQGNVKSGLVTRLARAPIRVGFDFRSVAEWPNLFFTNRRIAIPPHQSRVQDYLSVVRGYFLDKNPFTPTPQLLHLKTEERLHLDSLLYSSIPGGAQKVMVCPGSAWKNKQVTVRALQDFLKKLHQDLKCTFLFAWGSEEERQTAHQLHTCLPDSLVLTRLSLPLLQNLMQATQLVVSMDSLPLHLAGLAGVPTFAVFGPSLAAKYNPDGDRHLAVQGACPYGQTFDKRCPKLRTCATGACIRGLTGDDLYDAFRSQAAVR